MPRGIGCRVGSSLDNGQVLAIAYLSRAHDLRLLLPALGRDATSRFYSVREIVDGQGLEAHSSLCKIVLKRYLLPEHTFSEEFTSCPAPSSRALGAGWHRSSVVTLGQDQRLWSGGWTHPLDCTHTAARSPSMILFVILFIEIILPWGISTAKAITL